MNKYWSSAKIYSAVYVNLSAQKKIVKTF